MKISVRLMLRVAGGLVIAALVAWGLYVHFSSKNSVKTPASQVVSTPKQTFKSDEYGVKFSYDAGIKSTPLSDDDKKSKILLRLEKTDPPEFLITVKGETGLSGPAELSRVDTLELVTNGALKSLPGRYTNYQLITDSNLEITGRKAHEIIFTYDGPSGDRAKQRLVLLSANSDDALYISMQAREADYDNLNQNVFAEIVKSITYL